MWRLIDQEIPLPSALTANSLVTSGQIVSSHPAVCGVHGTIYTKTARRKKTSPQLRHAASASWRKGRECTPPTTVVADMKRRNAKEKTLLRTHQQEERSLRNFQLPAPPLLRHSGAPQSSPNNSNKTDLRKFNVVKNLIMLSQSGPHVILLSLWTTC
jgi:hypothetical protein